MTKKIITLLLLVFSLKAQAQVTSTLTQITTDYLKTGNEKKLNWADSNLSKNVFYRSESFPFPCSKKKVIDYALFQGWVCVYTIDCHGNIDRVDCTNLSDLGSGGGGGGSSSGPTITTPPPSGPPPLIINPPPIPFTPPSGGGGSTQNGGNQLEPGAGLNPIEPNLDIRDDNSDNSNETNHKKVDIIKMLNCFNQIPSLGAKFEVVLNVDIPKNGNPDKLISGSDPGHVFVTLKKTAADGVTSIEQSFGFYPTKPIRNILSLGSSPTKSFIVNDGNGGHEHEINASIKMENLTSTNFATLINTAIIKSSQDYNITDYNCASFALDVFNSIRPQGTKLNSHIMTQTIPTYPPIIIPFIHSPSGLYKTLQDMYNQNNRTDIQLGINTKTPTSYGECN